MVSIKLISSGKFCYANISLIFVFWLATRSQPNFVRFNEKVTSTNIVIASELAVISEKLCLLWTLMRDKVLRKYNFPSGYKLCYGLDFNIKNNRSHLFLCILLAGDIATNPGPITSSTAQAHGQKLKQQP
jgi:hypothetical protein